MSGGHTPGPWEAGINDVPYADLDFECWTVDAPDVGAICTVDCAVDEREANARLIAAAPDYDTAAEQAVEALNAMMDAWFDYHDAHSLTQPVTGAAGNAFDKALDARERLEAAIARARGEA